MNTRGGNSTGKFGSPDLGKGGGSGLPSINGNSNRQGSGDYIYKRGKEPERDDENIQDMSGSLEGLEEIVSDDDIVPLPQKNDGKRGRDQDDSDGEPKKYEPIPRITSAKPQPLKGTVPAREPDKKTANDPPRDIFKATERDQAKGTDNLPGRGPSIDPNSNPIRAPERNPESFRGRATDSALAKSPPAKQSAMKESTYSIDNNKGSLICKRRFRV